MLYVVGSRFFNAWAQCCQNVKMMVTRVSACAAHITDWVKSPACVRPLPTVLGCGLIALRHIGQENASVAWLFLVKSKVFLLHNYFCIFLLNQKYSYCIIISVFLVKSKIFLLQIVFVVFVKSKAFSSLWHAGIPAAFRWECLTPIRKTSGRTADHCGGSRSRLFTSDGSTWAALTRGDQVRDELRVRVTLISLARRPSVSISAHFVRYGWLGLCVAPSTTACDVA